MLLPAGGDVRRGARRLTGVTGKGEGLAGLRWSLLTHPALSGAENMAWDHTLAEWCPPGRGVVRFYTWSPATLSLGRNEPALGRYDEGRIHAAEVDLVRRPTGGRAVLHHRELTYSVIVPRGGFGGPRELYSLVNQGLAQGLVALGARVEVTTAGDVVAPDAGPCFQLPAPGEVVAGGRKLVGSAQVRLDGALLQHGSILLADDQARIPSFATDPGASSNPPATLRELLSPLPSLGELRTALAAGLAHVLPGDWRGISAQGNLGSPDLPPAPRPELLRHYRSREWTWRR